MIRNQLGNLYYKFMMNLFAVAVAGLQMNPNHKLEPSMTGSNESHEAHILKRDSKHQAPTFS